MSNKIKSNALAMLALAMAAQGGNSALFSGIGEEAFIHLPKEPIQPSGCKTYFFDLLGNFSTTQMLKNECVFKCFAINDKNAIRKFNSFKKTFTPNPIAP